MGTGDPTFPIFRAKSDIFLLIFITISKRQHFLLILKTQNCFENHKQHFLPIFLSKCGILLILRLEATLGVEDNIYIFFSKLEAEGNILLIWSRRIHLTNC